MPLAIFLRLFPLFDRRAVQLLPLLVSDQIELPVAVITHFELLFRVECLDNFESFSFAGTFLSNIHFEFIFVWEMILPILGFFG